MKAWWRRGPKAKTITLALQGGGAHGAYTWGVLDRLLADPRIVIEGVSATSAGAMNAAVLAQGLMTGGVQGGRAALESFWHGVSGAAQTAPFQSTWLSRWLGSWNMGCFPATLALDVVPPMFSPYKLNPFNLNPLRDLLVKTIDFDRLKDCSPVKLFISASNVRSGRIKVFETRELSASIPLSCARCGPLPLSPA